MSPRRPLVLAVLAVVTFVAFAGVLGNGWVLFDDPQYVTDNTHVRAGFTPGAAAWFLVHGHDGNWDPLPSWSHLLDVQLFGLAPAGHHATSLLFHVANAVLLAWALFRLTGAWWRSVFVAALFALHPLRVESVAWIAERKDVMSGTFFLLTLLAYRRWAERPGGGRAAWVAALFALGLLCKPMLVTLPLVLVLLDVWPLGRLSGFAVAPAGAPPVRARSRSLAGLVAEKAPLFALAAASTVVTWLVQRAAGAVATTAALPLARRLPNALLSYARYVGMTAWPARLGVFYPYARRDDWPGAGLCAVGLVAVTALVLRRARRWPWLAVGWLWYAIMLLPVCGLVQVGGHAYADRFTYLPTIGLAIALAWSVGALVVARPALARMLPAPAAAILVVLAASTAAQVATWKDTLTLFTHDLAVTTDNPTAHNYVGYALYQAGQPAQAIPHFEETLRLSPDYPEARNFLASALGAAGRYDDAAAQFRLLLRERESPDLHFNLGMAEELAGRRDSAAAEYAAALRMDPRLAPARSRLAALQAASPAALAARAPGPAPPPATGAVRDSIEAARAQAAALVQQDRIEDAIRLYEAILRRDANDLDALNNVAWIRATHAQAAHRNGAEAVRLAERARDHAPAPVAVLYSTLAAAYAEAGRFHDATAAGERAVALAQAAHDETAAAQYAQQLALYRAGKPFHFTR